MRSFVCGGILAFFFLTSAAYAADPCVVLVRLADGKLASKKLGSLAVDSLAPEQQFVMPSDAPEGVVALQCFRQKLALGPNDYKPLLAGYTLGIVTDDRVGVLEVVDGRLQFRMVAGALTAEESVQVEGALNIAQAKFNQLDASQSAPLSKP